MTATAQQTILLILLYIFIDSSKDTTMIEYLWAVLSSNEHYVTDIVPPVQRHQREYSQLHLFKQHLADKKGSKSPLSFSVTSLLDDGTM